jgi:hypothetical protein
MMIELSTTDLRLATTALAAFKRVLKNLDAAKRAGIVPACFEVPDGHGALLDELHQRFDILTQQIMDAASGVERDR